MLGGLLGFASKLFGSKEKTHTVSNTVDYKALVRNAEAAGFNPLTALRNGGSAGFTQTHTPVMSRNVFGMAMDTLDDTLTNLFGGGSGRGVQAAFDYNPLEESKSRLELQIMQGQLKRINQQNDAFTRLGNQPSATGSRFKQQSTNLSKGAPLEAGDRTVTNPWPDGIEVNPHLVDAEILETRYSEGPLTNIVGWGVNGTADALWNLGRGYRVWRGATERTLGRLSRYIEGNRASVVKLPKSKPASFSDYRYGGLGNNDMNIGW
nr:hypothetical protein [uncultured Cohaesibacter sp.]